MKPTKPPELLIASFRALEAPLQLAALTMEDGFDVDGMRVLGAWRQSEHVWERPASECPDLMRPTPANWKWLLAGWRIDIEAIAEAANVPYAVARGKIDLLTRNRLIYPDGQTNKFAEGAMSAHIAQRFTNDEKAKPKAEPIRRRRNDDDDGDFS